MTAASQRQAPGPEEHGEPTITSDTDGSHTLSDSSLADYVPRDADALPRQIARYEVLRLLGSGNMGVVYLARDPELDRQVALKFLNPDGGGGDLSRAEARMRREARAMARLRHRGIVNIHECGTHEGRLFLAMEYVEGRTLGDWQDRPDEVLPGGESNPPPAIAPSMVVRLGIELFDALAHAHQHEVVHRDLKPENIFICADSSGEDHLVVADFGVAKINAAGAGPTATRAGTAIGTPLYMSPEQAGGLPVDARADLFSAGLILIRLLTGGVPLRARTALDQIRVRAARDIPPLPASYPDELRYLCADLCARDLDDRIASAGEARERLQAMKSAWAQRGETWDEPILPPANYNLDVSLRGSAVDTGTETETESLTTPTRVRGAETTAGTGDRSSSERASPVAGSAKRRVVVPLLAAVAGVAALGWILQPKKTEAPAAKPEPSPVEAKQPPADPPPEPAPADPETKAAVLEANPGETPTSSPSVLEKLGKINTVEPTQALPYAERHALLRELEKNPSAAPFIDHRINIGLDLLQAQQAEDPCAVFSTALTAIDAGLDAEFLPVVEQATVPSLSDGKTCEGLSKRLKRTKRKLSRRPRPRPRPGKESPKTDTESDSGHTPSAAHPVPVTEKLDG
ncbi:MAG: serine/threonine-protein kinase [Myxococcota bacterium]